MFSRRLCSKGLSNGIDIIVNRLGHAHNKNLALVLFIQVLRKHGGLCVGIVPSNSMQNVNLILEQLLRGDLEWGGSFLDVATLDAVGRVCELTTRDK